MYRSRRLHPALLAAALLLASPTSALAGPILFEFPATVAFPGTGFGATADYNAPGGNGLSRFG
jgi:hypothetical protein